MGAGGHRIGVRGRSALVTAATVAVGLVIGGFALLALFRWQLLDTLDQTLRQAAVDRAALLEQGADPAALTAQLGEESMVWIGRSDGTEVASNGLVPLENPVAAFDDDHDDGGDDSDETDDSDDGYETDDGDESDDDVVVPSSVGPANISDATDEDGHESESVDDHESDDADDDDSESEYEDYEDSGAAWDVPTTASMQLWRLASLPAAGRAAPAQDGPGSVSVATPGNGGAVQVVPLSDGAVSLLVREMYEPGHGPERKDLRMVAVLAPTRNMVVIVATETDLVTGPIRSLGMLFAAALPMMMALVVGLTWWTAGSALQSVERIRTEAASVTGSDLSRRVPVPPARDEVHDLAVTVNEMLSRLEADQRRMRQFTADASHELRSPVANLRSMIETTGRTELGDTADGRWSAIRPRLLAETDRLQGLIDNLLYLAARDAATATAPSTASGIVAAGVGAESGAASVPAGHGVTAVSLDDLLFDEASVLSATTEARIDVSGVEPVIVAGVHGNLQRLVRNLTANAARHHRSAIALACDVDPDGQARIVVADDGAGIAPEDRERVFERFTRLDEARDRDRGGSGLGLAIVAAIAADHGGRAWVEDNAPGARFVVTVGPAQG